MLEEAIPHISVGVGVFLFVVTLLVIISNRHKKCSVFVPFDGVDEPYFNCTDELAGERIHYILTIGALPESEITRMFGSRADRILTRLLAQDRIGYAPSGNLISVPFDAL